MGRYPMCKNCANIVAGENGSFFCKERGEETKPDRSFACESYVKTLKQKKTPEELSLIRSQAGRKGAIAKGSGYGTGGTPTCSMHVRKSDYETFASFATKRGVSITEAFHRVCANLAVKYLGSESQDCK